MHRRFLIPLAAVLLLGLTATPAGAVGKYCLAFWRETGSYEKGGIGGTHIINVHVWDAAGSPVIGVHVYSGTLDMGETDQWGQLEIPIYMPNAYPLRIVDGGNLTDECPGFSSTRAPDWGHYSFECGFIYVADSTNTPAVNLVYDGVFNSSSNDAVCNNYQMSAPRTRSLGFCSTRPDLGYYCSDAWEGGTSVPSVGQTFKATGNRVVACKFSPVGLTAQYVARIREGGPTGAYVGSAVTSHTFGEYEFSKTILTWGLASVPVVSGSTYFLEITKLDGSNVRLNRVVNNNDSGGCYYEGTTPNVLKDLRGWVCSVTYGTTPGRGSISGYVKDTSNNPITGATVATNTGGYTTTTNASGNYTLLDIAVGTYSVTASKTGYLPQTNTNVTVNEGQTATSNFNLTLNAGTIAGYVRDTAGSPITGAAVSTNTGGYSTTSGGDGSYTLSNVIAGTYDVTASKAGYLPQTQTGRTVVAGQTTTASFNIGPGTELLTNGSFTSGCTGWLHSESPAAIYWGCGYKAYPGTSPGSGGHSWNAFLACGGVFCDRTFVGEQHQDNVTVYAGMPYQASAQVYYEPVKYPNTPGDQKERLVLTFNSGATHTSDWHVHTTSNGWDQILCSGTVPTGATKVSFKVELSQVDGQWSGTGAVDECSLASINSGVISGYVRNTPGDNLGGAVVTTNTGGYSATTGSGGLYTISNVAPGTYDVTASCTGYNSGTRTGKTVTVGGTTTVDFALIDSSPPTQPTITDDGRYQPVNTQLHAVWTSSEPQTRIAEYQYRIGTSAGAGDVVDWTSTGTSAGVTKTGLSLAYTLAYYFSVKARNSDNLWSSVGSSDGIRPARVLSTVSAAKSYADGECVQIAGRIVSAVFADGFYIEDGLRLAGIKVTGAAATLGATVTITGVLATADNERVITNAQVE